MSQLVTARDGKCRGNMINGKMGGGFKRLLGLYLHLWLIAT